jgi:oxazoline/thiazoline dehydrogenase
VYTADEIVGLACKTEASACEGRVNSFIASLSKLGLLSKLLTVNEHPVLRLVPLVANRPLPPIHVEPTKRYMLSRFAFMRKREGCLAIESPLAFHRVELLHPASLSIVFATIPDEMGDLGLQILDVLLTAGIVVESDVAGQEVHEDVGLQQWEFHDLLFHARSRPGRNDSQLGRTFRFLDKIEPLPALKTPSGGPTIQLDKADIEVLRHNDLPFTDVLEGRRSIRLFGSHPITAKELGEFLFRTARVRRLHPRDNEKLKYESSDRPYPGGGGCYELEIYAVIDTCDGIPKGVYYYDPFNHQLELLASEDHRRNILLDNAAQANGTGARTQVLFIITARFQRMNWKYETMAYAAILKNVGVLYQSMYLVATAMQLAPCALGAGDPHPLGEITGDPYWIESSVGEFMLGSLPDEPYSQF